MAPMNTKVNARKKCSEKIIHHLVNAARKLKHRKVKLNSVLKRKPKLSSSSETREQVTADSLAPASTTPTESPSLQNVQQIAELPDSLRSPCLISDLCHPGSTASTEPPSLRNQHQIAGKRDSLKSPSLISSLCYPTITPLRVRSPSISPVVVPCLSEKEASTSPGQTPHHRFSPGWHQSFSISAILARASSTPKKEDSISLQSSVCSSFVTSSESGSTNMSPEFPEQNKENSVSCLHDIDQTSCPSDHRAASSNHCNSCQHNHNARRKMERTKFSKEDIQILNDYFWKDRYPSAMEIEQLAKQLGYRVVQIKTWFQNKRASVSGTRQPKAQNPSQVVTYAPPSLAGHHQTMFLPVAKSLMDNVQYHPALFTRSHPVPSVNLLAPFPAYSATIDTRFAPGATSHFVAAPHSTRGMPPSIVTHFPPVSPFHYFGNGYL